MEGRVHERGYGKVTDGGLDRLGFGVDGDISIVLVRDGRNVVLGLLGWFVLMDDIVAAESTERSQWSMVATLKDRKKPWPATSSADGLHDGVSYGDGVEVEGQRIMATRFVPRHGQVDRTGRIPCCRLYTK
jgi:hypothetical protein